MEMMELAEKVERAANNTLKSADRFWTWRKRDRKISVALGQLSRDLREVSDALRSRAMKENGDHGAG